MDDSNPKRVRWWAAGLSFLVYLLPVAFPHVALLWGWVLLKEMQGERAALWLAADIVLALILQLAAGLLLYWFLRRPGWLRGVATLAAVPVLWFALEILYLVGIPTLFLIEADRKPELALGAPVCTVTETTLTQIYQPAVVAGFPEAVWVEQYLENRRTYGLLRMPDCAVERIASELGINTSIPFGTTTGALLVHASDRETQQYRWMYVESPKAAAIELAEPEGYSQNFEHPMLSADGEWVAWPLWNPSTTGGKPVQTFLLQSLTGLRSITLKLPPIERGRYTLLDVNAEFQHLLLALDGKEFLVTDFHGRVARGPMKPQSVNTLSRSFRLTREGWVAWDAYREEEAYQVEWSLPRGSGLHRVPKGRSIQSVAVGPGGRYIAVSVGGQHSIGSVRDAVYVFRAEDGEEVFRRYLPSYTRSQVAFLGDQYFAHSVEGAVEVLRLPE